MKNASVEFSRPLIIDRVPRGGSYEKLKADPKELLALAARLNVPALHNFSAELRATPWRGGGLRLEGTLVADLDQVSVVSLEPFHSTVTYAVDRYFLPAGKLAGDEEVEADPIIGGEVDLGEVVTETLALELDPYPRQAGEEFAEHIEFEEEAQKPESPFAALARLKDG